MEPLEIEEPMKAQLKPKKKPDSNNAPKKKKWFGGKTDWTDLPDREIIANNQDYTSPNNEISTSKYSVLTFLPLNLIEQFSKGANQYFLMIGVLQMIKEISISGGQPVILAPLAFIVAVSAIKDLLEDRKRKKSDTQENMRKVQRNKTGSLQKCRWKDLRVGDVVKIYENEYLPCDVLLVGSSDPKGQAYIETKNLDGETNLKHKVVPKDLRRSYETEREIRGMDFVMMYEKPNPYLYSFKGTLLLEEEKKVPCDASNFILRGCSLRNTEWIYGLVAYTGHQTKIMLNSVNAKPKQSNLEKTMSKEILIIFFVQCFLCLGSGLYYSLWTSNNMEYLSYLHLGDTFSVLDETLVRFGNWILIFTNFVPISLLVTLEMVKVLQGSFISSDRRMREPTNNIFATVQSSSLNEELGQIDYVFSDKTGTLTCNLMEFKKLSISGKPFGNNRDLNIKNFPKCSNVDFKDKEFQNALEDPSHPDHGPAHKYLLFLALCHTIITQKKGNETVYNAASPDEFALVNFAKFMGYEYLGINESNDMMVRYRDEHFKYRLHHVLEFTSARKRMSVILEDQTGTMRILCKGADSIVLKRMKESPLTQPTLDSLEAFASEGLRTLLLAEREIPADEYRNWTEKFMEASTSMVDRDAKIEEVQELIETNLELVGATAIEDKLQDEVGPTIDHMKKAGIKVWVLTGDKVETAINIAYSCQLMNNSYFKQIIDGQDLPAVKRQIDKAKEKINPHVKNAVIITGDALIHAMASELSKELMKVCEQCESVVCCRVSPKQKQEVVSLVRREKPHVKTLAIGDGANDVNMIIAAHVGIGIRGVEGQQAARASDYAIGEFKNLKNLLFVHGRECYRRNSYLVLYNFYKNIVLVSPQFWYGIPSQFSGQTLYDPVIYQFFNMFFTALPIIFYAVLDREFDDRTLLRHPKLYMDGPNNVHFSAKKYWTWFVLGFFQGFIIYYFTFEILNNEPLNEDDGWLSFFWANGNIAYMMVVWVTNLKIMIFSYSISFVLCFFTFGSIAFFYLCYYLFNILKSSELYGTFSIYAVTFDSWHITILVCACTFMIDLAVSRKTELIREDRQLKIITNQFEDEESNELDVSFDNEEFEEQYKAKYKGFAFSQDERMDPERALNYRN